jgi:superoxide dismutase, Fe-Mn family
MEEIPMSFTLAPLPFDKKALAPYISEETIDYHYGKHHKTYVDNLNQLLAGKDLLNKPLIEIIRSSEGSVFNNAGQIWNHDFYWRSLQKDSKENEISKELMAAINLSFGGLDKFKEQFTKASLGLFGSGWVWLVKDNQGLAIVTTTNANSPITTKQIPLFTCDVWEHAYYIDYRNSRAKYLESFWHVVNWHFASANFSG